MTGEEIYNEVCRAGSVAEAVAGLSGAGLLKLWLHAEEVSDGIGIPVLIAAECTAQAADRWRWAEEPNLKDLRP